METASPPASHTTDIDGEQHRVTLMFADISGSTELVERLDPEEAANLLDPMIGVMTETVERYAGTISPRGDGILAVFGIGGTAEDSTARACFAAMEILQRLESSTGRVRIGIHQGEIAVLSGRRRRSRENLFGPAIHIAARLEQAGEPGTASLSADAYALVQDFVEVEPLPPVDMKGISRPLQRVRLLRMLATSRWRARLAQGLAVMVGRQAELAALTGFLRDTAGPGVRLVQVLGPAGIGKSRLVHELLRAEPARASYVITFAGPVHRGYAGHDPIALWLRDMVDPDDAGTPAGLVERLPGAGLLTAGERGRLARYLDGGRATDGRVAELDAIAPLRVNGPVAAIVASAACGRPVIISCEDAEAFGNDRLEQIAALSSAVARHGLPLTLVISSRRAVKLPAGGFTARKTLRLPALAPDAARQLLVRLHPELRRRPELIDPVLSKAGGNPLFLEEVAALFLSARMSRDGDDGIAGAIPDRIEALIADRLAGIPRPAQALLLVCSVLGNAFSPGLLPAVTDQRAGRIEEHLAKLKAQRLLYEVPAAPEPRLEFSHPLIRDVAYATLLPSKRRSLHEKVFRLLHGQSAVGLEDLCHHAVNAALWPESLRYLQQAAVAAAERAAYASAEQHLRRALKIAEQQPQDRPMRRTMVEIMVGMRALLALDLRHAEADELLDRAQALGADLDPAMRLAVQVKRVRALNTSGRLREAIALAGETRRQARDAGIVAAQLAATHFLGQSYFYVGRFVAGDAVLAEDPGLSAASLDRSEFSVGHPLVLIPATRAGIRSFLGRFAEAESDVAQALAAARSRNAAYDLSFAHFVAGMVQLQQRHLEPAEVAFRTGLGSAEHHGLKALVPLLNVGLGSTLLLGGSTNAANPARVDAREHARDTNRVLCRLWGSSGLAAAYGSTGGTASALRHADEAVRLGARHTLRGLLVAALRCRGALLATQEASRAEGVRAVRQSLALARKLGMRPDVAHCLTTLAAILDRGDARAEAQAVYRSLGMAPWAEHVLERGFGSVPLSVIAA